MIEPETQHMQREPGDEPSAVIRMELSYCPRCGSLRIHPAGTTRNVCAACVRALAWLYQEQRGGGR